MKSWTVLLFAVALVAGCGSPSEQAPSSPAAEDGLNEFPIRGEIVSVNTEAQSAAIRHERIEGFMDAMTMTFPIPEESDLEKIQPGDQITATVYLRPSDSSFWVGNIEVLEQ